MAGFVFRLQSFLGIKEKIEEQKELEYGKSMQKLNNEKNILEGLKNSLRDVVERFKEALKTNIDTKNIRNYNIYIDNLKDRIKKQKIVVEKAEKEADKKRNELVEAMKERKMLETLKEHDKEAYMKEQLKKEQKITDEIVSYKYSIK